MERFAKWTKEWKPIIEKWNIKITVEGDEELEKLREILKRDITKKIGWANDVSVWGPGRGVIRETAVAVAEMWKQVQAGNLAWETFELYLRASAQNSGPEMAEWISGMLPLLGKLKAVMPGLGEGKGGPSPEEVEKTKQQEAAARQLRALQAQMAITEAQTKRLSLATRENTFAVEMAQQAIAAEKQAMSDAEPFWEAWQKQLGESEEKEISLVHPANAGVNNG